MKNGEQVERAQQSFSGVNRVVANGGTGNDSIDIGSEVMADALLSGGDGADVLSYAGLGVAMLKGDDGDDVLVGGEQDDVLEGGDGDDRLSGRGGNDTLRGQNDDDLLDGGAGIDTKIGGSGSDTYAWTPGEGEDIIFEAAGDAGDIDRATIGGSFNLTDGSYEAGLVGAVEADDTITVSQFTDGSQQKVLIETAVGMTAGESLILDNIENIAIAAGGGSDTVSFGDLTGTDVNLLAVDLSAADETNSQGDVDRVIYFGTEVQDILTLSSEVGSFAQTDFTNPDDVVVTSGIARPVVKIRDTSPGRDSTAFIINSSPDKDILEVRGLGGDDTLTVAANQDPSSGENLDVSDLIQVELEGGDDDDTIVTAFDNVDIDGGAGTDSLEIKSDGKQLDNSAALTLFKGDLLIERTETGVGQVSDQLSFADVEQFTLKLDPATAGNELRVVNTIDGNVAIVGGSENDVMFIETISGTTSIDLNAGDNTVTVGKDGSLAGIAHDLDFIGGDDNDHVIFDTSAEVDDELATIGVGALLGLVAPGALRYNDLVETVELRLGIGDDKVVIPDLTRRVIVDGGDGNDEVAGTLFGTPNGALDGPGIETTTTESVIFNNEANTNDTNWLVTFNTVSNETELRAGIAGTFDPLLPGNAYSQLVLQSDNAAHWTLNLGEQDSPATSGDAVAVEAMTLPIDINLRAGEDVVTVGPNLAAIDAQLTVNGDGDDQLIIDDSGAPTGGELTTVKLGQIEASRGGDTATIMHSGIGTLRLEMSDFRDRINYLDSDVADTTINTNGGIDEVEVLGGTTAPNINTGAGDDVINVLAANTSIRVDGGGDNDALNFDVSANTSPQVGAELIDNGSLTELRNLGPVNSVVFEGIEDVNVALGQNSDTLTLDYTASDFNLLVEGRGGDDTITIKQIGGQARIIGESGFDTVVLDIPNSPQAPQLANLGSDLRVEVEKALVDNQTNPNGVNWRVANDLLSARDAGGSNFVDLLFTDGAEEVRILAGSAADTLDVEEQAKIVDATINADQVSLELGPVVLESRDTGDYLNFDDVIDFTNLNVSNNYNEDGTTRGLRLASSGSIVRDNTISASAAGGSFSDEFTLTPNGGAAFALYSLELRNEGAVDRVITFNAVTLNGSEFSFNSPVLPAGGDFVTVNFPDTFSALKEVSWISGDTVVDDIVSEIILPTVNATSGPQAIARSTLPTNVDIDLIEFNTSSLTIRTFDWVGSSKVLLDTFTSGSNNFYGLPYNITFGVDGNGNIDTDIVRWNFQGDFIIPNIGAGTSDPGVRAYGTRGLSIFATNNLDIRTEINVSGSSFVAGAGGANGSEGGERGTAGTGFNRGGNGGDGSSGEGGEGGFASPGQGEGGSGGSAEQPGSSGGSTTLSGGGGGGGGGVELPSFVQGAGGGGGQGGDGFSGDEGIDGRRGNSGINGGTGGAGSEGGEEGAGGEGGAFSGETGEKGEDGDPGTRGDNASRGNNNGLGATISGGGAGGSGAGGGGGGRGGGGAGGDGGNGVAQFGGEQGGAGGGHGGHGGAGGAGGLGGDGGAGGGAIEIAARGTVFVDSNLRAQGGDGAEGTAGIEGSGGSEGESGRTRSIGQNGSRGGDGGTGGDGGQGGDGAGGAGGTIKLSGTQVNADGASVNTAGGLGGFRGNFITPANDGEDGRFIIESNVGLTFSGSALTGIQGTPGTIQNVQQSNVADQIGRFIGPRADNPYLAGPDHTPFIANLVGGSEVFGLLNGVNIDSFIPSVGALAPESDAVAAIMRLDIGPFANSPDYTGYDMLLFMNLTDVNLDNPSLGINTSVETDLMFDGVGSRTPLDTLNANSVWVTLIKDNNVNDPGNAVDFVNASIGGSTERFRIEQSANTIRDNEILYIRATGENIAISELTGIDALAASPDGQFLYGVNTDEDALVVINADDLTQRQIIKDGFDNANLLANPTDVAVSADGAKVYVISSEGLSIFAPQPSGELNLVQADPTFGAGLDRKDAMTVRPTSAPFGDLIVTSGAGGIWIYVDQGIISEGPGSAVNTSDVVYSTDGSLLYAAQPDLNRVQIFDGENPLTSVMSLNMSDATAIGTANNQNGTLEHLYVASESGELFVFERTIGGAINPTAIQSFSELSDDGIRGLVGANDVAVSADGRFVYITSRNGESIVAFQRDVDTGELRFAQLLRGRTGLEAPSEIAIVGGSNPGVFVGSAIGGVAAFNPIAPSADAELQRLRVGYENLERLSLTTGNNDDVIRQINAATVDNLLVNANAGFNEIDFLNVDGTTTILTGFNGRPAYRAL